VFSIGIFIYLVGVALYSNYFIPIPGMVADRFMYIPSLGWCIVLICGLAHLFKLNNIRDGNTQPTNKGFLVVVLTVLLCYSYMSYARSFDWKNHLTLMRKDLNHVPNSAQAHNLLALNIMKFSTETPMPPAEQFVMWQEATTHFKRSLEIYPKTFNVAFDLGRVYGMLNKTDSAIYYYKKAIFLDSTYIQLYLNIGELLFGKGDLRGAIPYYQKYMELTSNSYEGYGKLSFVYFQLKEFDQSIAINKLAIQQLPFVADPYTNIGRVYLSLNKKQEALFWLEKADSIMQGRDVEVRKMLKK
jgi:tetratricopeptide (TPR) repeat protein